MKSVGLTEKDLEQQYQYTKEIVNDGGVQKGVTWQATPRLFAYRRSIARQVPGTDDSTEVQGNVFGFFYSTWGINSDGLLEYSDTMDRNATTLKQDAVANKLNTSQTVIEMVQELIKNADALVTYIQENILPDYDKFVAAGAQYNDNAVYINGVVVNFNAMSSDLRQRMH